MKKTMILLISMIVAALVLAACGNKDKTDSSEAADISEQASESAAEQSLESETTKAAVANEKPIYLYYMDYASDTAERLKVYETEFTTDEDIGVFAALAVDGDSFDFIEEYGSEIGMQQETWDSVDASAEYKIGYEISFDVNGEHKLYTILEPADVADEEDLFMGDVDTDELNGYIGIWLYDDYHQDGSFYDHVDPDEYDEDTLLTSIKLRLLSDSSDISNLVLRAFSYSNSLEFDSDGHYNNDYSSEIRINIK